MMHSPPEVEGRVAAFVNHLLAGVKLPSGAVDEVRADFVQHLADDIQRLVGQGRSIDDAWREACTAFGEAPEIRRQLDRFAARGRRSRRLDVFLRDLRALPGRALHTAARLVATARRGARTAAADLQADVRLAWRQWRKSPSAATVAVVTLALGIGLGAAMFSAVYAVLLRPFPYPDADRLAVISISWPEGRFWLSEREVVLLREQSTLFEGFGVLDESGTTLLGRGDPEWLQIGLVSSNTFPLVGVSPLIGRPFTQEEEQPEAPPVAILSHELWQRRFGGDPDIIGRLLETSSSRPLRVVGVMPPRFAMLLAGHLNFHRQVDAWVPHQVDYRTIDRGRNLVVLARKKDAVSWAQAQDELDRIAKGFFPADSSNTYRAFPLQADTVAAVRAPLLLLMAATGFLLVIVGANVTNLLLARGVARQRELTIRTALGASRSRLVRQVLTESALLALCGGGAGVLLASTATRGLAHYIPRQVPRVDTIQVDGVVLGAAVGVSLLVGLCCGLVAAVRASRVKLDETLKMGVRGSSAAGTSRILRSALIVAEVAIALMLIVGGTVIARGFLTLRDAPLGYNPHGVLTFTVYLPPEHYPGATERNAVMERLQASIARRPEVESVGGATILPFSTSLFQSGFRFYDSTDGAGSSTARQVLTRPILPGYFEALQSRLLMGRLFTTDDSQNSERVAIIDETLAQSVWPNESPLGKRLARASNQANPSYVTVVGVVENLRIVTLSGGRDHQVYLPHSQFGFARVSFLVRSRSEPTALIAPIREILRSLDRRVAMYEIGRLDDTVAEVMAPERLTTLLMTLFSLIGLVLAVIGVYGVISYIVSLRTHEVGVRIALGARRDDVYRLLLGYGFRVAVAGVTIGVTGAVALTRAAGGVLPGLSPAAAGDYVFASGVLLAAALISIVIPAHRATRVDPVVVLRPD